MTAGKNQNLPVKSKCRGKSCVLISPFSQVERMGFCFFAKKMQSFKILTNRKDKDIEETSLKQSISLK